MDVRRGPNAPNQRCRCATPSPRLRERVTGPAHLSPRLCGGLPAPSARPLARRARGLALRVLLADGRCPIWGAREAPTPASRGPWEHGGLRPRPVHAPVPPGHPPMPLQARSHHHPTRPRPALCRRPSSPFCPQLPQAWSRSRRDGDPTPSLNGHRFTHPVSPLFPAEPRGTGSLGSTVGVPSTTPHHGLACPQVPNLGPNPPFRLNLCKSPPLTPR